MAVVYRRRARLGFQGWGRVGAGIAAQMSRVGAGADVVVGGAKTVLAEGAGLDDQFARFVGIEIDQAQDRALSPQLFDQGAHICRQAGAAALHIEVAQLHVQQAAVVDRLGAAQGQLDKRFGGNRIAPLPVVYVVLGTHVPILAHLRQTAAYQLVSGV